MEREFGVEVVLRDGLIESRYKLDGVSRCEASLLLFELKQLEQMLIDKEFDYLLEFDEGGE